MTLLASVHLNDLVRVDWVELVGVDHYAEEPRVGLGGEGEGLKVIRQNYQYTYLLLYSSELVCVHV